MAKLHQHGFSQSHFSKSELKVLSCLQAVGGNLAAPKRSRALPYGAESPQIPQQEAEEVPYHLSGSCCSESPSTSLIITKLLPAEPSGGAWSSATRQAGQHPCPIIFQHQDPRGQKIDPSDAAFARKPLPAATPLATSPSKP